MLRKIKIGRALIKPLMAIVADLMVDGKISKTDAILAAALRSLADQLDPETGETELELE